MARKLVNFESAVWDIFLSQSKKRLSVWLHFLDLPVIVIKIKFQEVTCIAYSNYIFFFNELHVFVVCTKIKQKYYGTKSMGRWNTASGMWNNRPNNCTRSGDCTCSSYWYYICFTLKLMNYISDKKLNNWLAIFSPWKFAANAMWLRMAHEPKSNRIAAQCC